MASSATLEPEAGTGIVEIVTDLTRRPAATATAACRWKLSVSFLRRIGKLDQTVF